MTNASKESVGWGSGRGSFLNWGEGSHHTVHILERAVYLVLPSRPCFIHQSLWQLVCEAMRSRSDHGLKSTALGIQDRLGICGRQQPRTHWKLLLLRSQLGDNSFHIKILEGYAIYPSIGFMDSLSFHGCISELPELPEIVFFKNQGYIFTYKLNSKMSKTPHYPCPPLTSPKMNPK